MDSLWLDRYIDVWLNHRLAGGPDGGDKLTQLTECMTPDVRYEDMATSGVYVGHGGIRDMARGAYDMSSDMVFEVLSRQTDGRMFSFENVTRGTNTGDLGPIKATGKPFVLRGVSVGTVTPDGRVSSHRDYWDMAGFLIQVGLIALPS